MRWRREPQPIRAQRAANALEAWRCRRSLAVQPRQRTDQDFQAVFDWFAQLGISSTPDAGGKVAWFHDPDGNNLSLTQA